MGNQESSPLANYGPSDSRSPWYGFNFQWMVSWQPGVQPQAPDQQALDFLAAEGFNFARIPTDYRFWIKDFAYFEPDTTIFGHLDRYLAATRSRNIHLSLNIHRAPGYCINHPEIERHNLWTDAVAQDAFVFQWELFARHFKGVPNEYLSFDLLNEPATPGELGMTRPIHERLMRRTVAAIRALDPDRTIVIDGLAGGHLAMPELMDLDLVHSGRGYQPMAVSHYHAGWWKPGLSMPLPQYPGCQWEGVTWDRETLKEFYLPWREVQAHGVPIHIGEFGCYNKTPNDVALRWLADLFSLFKEFGWGYGMWNLVGDFGIINHGRPGARYEWIGGYEVDRDLLELMRSSRI